MEFKSKLKIRLYVAVFYILSGIATIICGFLLKSYGSQLSMFGLAIAVIGIARTKEYFRITKNEQTLQRRKIAETDERNVEIMHRSKSAAFSVYIVIACITSVVLRFFDLAIASDILFYSVCLLAVTYWIFNFIYQKKS